MVQDRGSMLHVAVKGSLLGVVSIGRFESRIRLDRLNEGDIVAFQQYLSCAWN